MKQKWFVYGLAAAAAGWIVWACQHDRSPGANPYAVEPTLTVAEAQDFFEQQYAETVPYLTKLSPDRPTGLMPGDFTPLWDKTRIGANQEMDGADVPIDPRFIFTASFDRLNEQGETVQKTVDITQKLVVKKWRNAEEYKAFCYIVSIVPTPEYYADHKDVAKEFRYAGSKGRFSGFAVYQTLDGVLVGATRYRDGHLLRHAYFPQITRENADSVAAVMDDLTGPVSILGGTMSTFRLGTEENPVLADEVLVTAKRNTSNPWLLTISLQFRPSGLPTNNPNPIDITYTTPYIRPIPGGGGGVGTTTSTQGKPTKFQDDCNNDKQTVKSAAGDLLDIMKQVPKSTYGTPTYSDFMQKVQQNPSVEHAMVLKTDFHSNTLYFGEILSAEKSEDFVELENNSLTTAIIHSHPNSNLTPPSPLDAVELGIQLADGNGDVQANYVVVGNDIYCLQVTDPDKAKAFAAANPIKTGSSMFDSDSPAGNLWKNGSERMGAIADANERFCATMSYVLGRLDAGIMLLRMKAGKSTFEALGVAKDTKDNYYPTRCQ